MPTPTPSASEGGELKGSVISTGAPAAPTEDTWIDIGEPIKIIDPQSRAMPRHPAASVAPVPQGAPTGNLRVVIGAPKATAERSWRDDYGVAKRL